MLAKEKERYLEEIEKALEDLRPHLRVDGGDIELIELTDDMEVKVKWLGNCEFCTMSTMTMKAGVEQAIMKRLPNVKKITPVNGMVINE